jgi:hypothetical protein
MEFGKERDLIFGEQEGVWTFYLAEKIQSLLGQNPSQPTAPKFRKHVEAGQPRVQAGVTRKIIQN